MQTVFRARSPKVVAAIIAVLSVIAAVMAVITVAGAQNTAKPTIRPFVASLPPEKQTAAAIGEDRIAGFATAHPGKVLLSPSETPAPLPAGIQTKYPNWWNIKQPFQNEWFGYIDGMRFSVYAGSVATLKSDGTVVEDPQQGYIAVAVGTDVNG